MAKRAIILTVLIALAAPALAQVAPDEKAGDVATKSAVDKTAPPTLPGLETFLHMVLWLVVIIVLIYVAVWLIRKYVPSARGVLGGGPLKIVTKMHVSAKQSLVLVKLGGRFVLVGVTPNSMTALAEISDPDEARKLTEDFAGQHGSSSFKDAMTRAENDQTAPGETQVGEVRQALDDVRRKVSWWRSSRT